MIKVTFYQDGDGSLCGFRMAGHAGFAKKGRDIVCAAASALAINTINSIDRFTGDRFVCDVKEKDPDAVSFFVESNPASDGSKLLLDSLRLGLIGVQSEYGKKHIKINMEKKREAK